MTSRIRCEQLETRDCPTVLFPNPQVPVNLGLPINEFHYAGVTSDYEDLIVINPAGTGMVEILHHRGTFYLDNGIVVPWYGVSEVGRTRLFATTSLRIVVDGGDGRDYIVNNTAVPCRFLGGAGEDYIVGGQGNDTLVGGSYPDTIIGQGGNDELQGNDGNDTLLGGTGADWLYGGADSDQLHGGPDSVIDHLIGGAHKDFFHRHWTNLAGNVHTTIDLIDDFSVADLDEDIRP